MKQDTFLTYQFSNPEAAIEVAKRMGWAPEQTFDFDEGVNIFTITYKEEDFPRVEFIFNGFM